MQEHGAAYEAGGLEVGQLILEVDNTKVEGMQHQVIVHIKQQKFIFKFG
jgi:C-terminal processing protease CtpA/Prc